MNEQLFQYIWQFQYYNYSQLITTENESVEIIKPGTLNVNQGPDFENARIKIGDTTWAGAVELHLKTSDWLKHQHDSDKNYNKVILHVVYENDSELGSIPVLELKTRISKNLIFRYNQLMKKQSFIPCENSIHKVPDIILNAWESRLLAERLTRKAMHIQEFQGKNKQHWEESFWWALARNFGNPVNSDAFETIAKTISTTILARHKNQIQQLEALLLGQAGLLEDDFNDPYPTLLKREYDFLKKKYQLQVVITPVHFLRMRPGNFPTVRLAQLAGLISQSTHLFSKILEAPSIKEVRKWFAAEANDFWNYHYTLIESTSFKKKAIGTAMINNIIINTIAPMLFLYGDQQDDNELKEKAIKWLEETPAEKNNIVKRFAAFGIKCKTAVDSQALLELKTQYCQLRNCLKCSVCNYLLKKEQ